MAYAMARERALGSESGGDSDSRIIARIAAGDREALAELYREWRRPLFAYLVQLTAGDTGMAEEILQDVLVAVWKNAGMFAGRSTARTWLIGIARRQAHNTLRRRTLPRAPLEEMASMPGGGPGPESQAIATAERAEVAAALAMLPLGQREILHLTFGQDLSYAEIAAVLDIPLGTVKSRLNSAKQAMRGLLSAAREAAS
jgi:RNA polymerase sigma factor (sigma-70 family)